MSDSNITRHPLILVKRRREVHERLLGGPLGSDSRTIGDFEAYLIAQCYTVDTEMVKDVEFTAVVHNDEVTFLRRVLEVERVDSKYDPTWTTGTHFVTSGRVPPFLKKIEGRPYPRGLRATKYKGVFLCHDLDTDEVWIEDKGGRVC